MGVSKTITAVKTSPHPTTSPNPAGKNVSNETALLALSTAEHGAEAGRAAVGRLPSPGASDQRGVSLCVSLPLAAFPIGECQVPEPSVW